MQEFFIVSLVRCSIQRDIANGCSCVKVMHIRTVKEDGWERKRAMRTQGIIWLKTL